jgi:hypothetical protein
MSVHHCKKVTFLQIQTLNFETLRLRPRNGWALVDLDLKTVGTDLAGGWYYLTSERISGTCSHTNRASLGLCAASMGEKKYSSQYSDHHSHWTPRLVPTAHIYAFFGVSIRSIC